MGEESPNRIGVGIEGNDVATQARGQGAEPAVTRSNLEDGAWLFLLQNLVHAAPFFAPVVAQGSDVVQLPWLFEWNLDLLERSLHFFE